MALVSHSQGDRSTRHAIYVWEGATNGGSPDTFDAVRLDRTPYSITIQTSGTYSGSASIALHGSLDGTNYAAMADPYGDTIALTGAGIANAVLVPLYIKPVMTSGDGSADIDVHILLRFDR